jgi:heavy metal efflux system protein
MRFRDGIEDYWARQRVQERIGDVTLPSGVSSSLIPMTAPEGEIFRYTVESDSKNLMELSEIHRWIIIPALKQVPGVAEADNFGGFTKEFRLDLDATELLRYGIGINDVTTAINANSANAGGGRVPRGQQSYIVRGVGLVRTLDDLGNIVVTTRGTLPILVRDLGTLTYTHQEREGVLGKNENPDTIEGIVQMLKYQNASQVIKDLKAKIAEIKPQLDALDVHLVPYIDRENLVRSTIDKVTHTVLEGIGLVCIVLIMFLGSWRSALVVGVTIPFAMMMAFVLMSLTKMSASMLSLGAIDFGIIVDGAIVVTENILRRREQQPTEELTPQDVRAATAQVARPIFFATLIIITAYFPLFALERGEARLFTPMAFTVGYALFGALLCTLALIPGLAYMALRKPRPMHHNRVLEWLTRAYQALLGRFIDRPKLAIAAVAIAFLAIGFLGPRVGRDYLPELDEGALWLQVQMPSGLSVDTAMEMASQLRRTVLEFPEVSYAVTQLGRSDEGLDAWTPSHIEAPIGLTPYSTWPAGETKRDFVKKLNDRLLQMPGYSIGISQPISDMVNDLEGGAHSPLVILIIGEDFKELRRIGEDVVNELHNIRGTASASIFQEPPMPQIAIEVDRAAAARYGINVSDVTNLVQTGIGGGAQVPLAQVAKITMRNGESTITREMNHRNITVRIDLADRDLVSYLAEARDRIAQNVKFDTAKYRIQYAGQFENQQRAQARLVLILGVVIGLMTLLLFAEFGRLWQAVMILCVVPMATLGGLIALLVTGETLNVASAVGFIALFGVAVQNGIIMVSNLNRVRETGVPLRDAVMTAAVERFRPVVMTATVATIGMMPAALATGVGSDVQRGLATVVVGGLILATLLTLFVVPAFYFSLERVAARWAPGGETAQPDPAH